MLSVVNKNVSNSLKIHIFSIGNYKSLMNLFEYISILIFINFYLLVPLTILSSAKCCFTDVIGILFNKLILNTYFNFVKHTKIHVIGFG